MGDTLRYAKRMDLIAMVPRGDLASTGFALANPGREYLVLQPRETSTAFSVTIEPGSYDVEWHSVSTRATTPGETLDVSSTSAIELTPPFMGPAVLYLARR
jgi:hypothetical protein